MTIPTKYSRSIDYFEDALDFLKTYQWFYNYPNTHILINDIFSKFPSEWLQYFSHLSIVELKTLSDSSLQCSVPSLRTLLNKINDLKPTIETEDIAETSTVQFSHNCGLSEKKRHEIVIFAPVINSICKDIQADLIVDIGSGLGYLSHLLHTSYNYKVLGIECSKQYVEMACKNQDKFYPASKNEVIFTEHFINTESAETIKSLIKHNFDSAELKSCCFAGLHACADLSVTVLDLFMQIDFVKSLIIMPCCYHRLKLKGVQEEEKECFSNFPISESFKNVYKKFGGEKFLRRPFLRLACQQSGKTFKNMSEKEHEEHARNLMFRCILQFVAESMNCDVLRQKRKSNTSKITDFEAYLKHLTNTHQLKPRTSDNNILTITDEGFLNKMRQKWKECEQNCYLMEILSAFQASIQSICENIILLDRVEYLREKGYTARIQKITNDIVSPRCFALIAVKNL